MKRRLFSLILTTLSWAAVASAGDQPKLQFDNTTFNFGKTSLVESVTGTFTFHNAGNALLKIEAPRPSCGCTIANLTTNQLNPGDKGELVFSLKPGPFPHAVSKQIVVPSNDPATPATILNIQGETIRIVESQPNGVYFGDVHLGTNLETTVTLKRTDGSKLVIDKIESSSDLITTRTEPVGDDGKVVRLHILLNAKGGSRTIMEQLRIFTPDSGASPGGMMAVGGTLVADVKVQPATLSWFVSPDAHGETDRTRSVLITATQRNSPLHPTNLKCNLPGVSVSLHPVTPDHQYEVVLKIPDKFNQTATGAITLDTDIASIPQLSIPVEIKPTQ